MSDNDRDTPTDEPVLTPEPEHGAAPDPADAESDIDGCDVPISEDEATPDEELPVTEGGVA
jgi:hypothetical protein